ncbi:MAG: hypothetical protein ABIO50_01905 [Nitrosospira sp.]
MGFPGATGLRRGFGGRLARGAMALMSIMSSGHTPLISEVIREDIDQLPDHIQGGSEAHVRYGVIMDLPVVGHPEVSGNRYPIDLYLISCADNDMMAFIVRFADSFRCLVLVPLGFLHLGGMLFDV